MSMCSLAVCAAGRRYAGGVGTARLRGSLGSAGFRSVPGVPVPPTFPCVPLSSPESAQTARKGVVSQFSSASQRGEPQYAEDAETP